MASRNHNIAPSEMIFNFLKNHYSEPGKTDLHQLTRDLQNQKPETENVGDIETCDLNFLQK